MFYFFNDDVEFYDNIIDRMIEISDSDTNIVVGATEDSNGKMSYGGVIKNSKIKPSFRVVMSGAEKIYCDTFCANCVLIPYIVFSRLDNIDNKFVHSLGDYDYGLTATKKGYKIVATDFFVGCCNDNPVSQGWRDNTKPRKERIKLKEQPKGLPRKIWFYFIKKHYGFFSAVIYSITPYIRILFKKINKSEKNYEWSFKVKNKLSFMLNYCEAKLLKNKTDVVHIRKIFIQ